MSSRHGGTRHDNRLFFSIEVIGLCSFYHYVIRSFFHHDPLAAVGIKTGIAALSAAARIISDDVINKILDAGVGDLMRFARLEKERVAFGYNCRSILVPNAATPRDDEIKLRFGRMRMIRTKRFAFRNPYQREIKRMPLHQIKRLRLTPECHRDILRRSTELALWRLSFLLWNVFQIYFAHIRLLTASS